MGRILAYTSPARGHLYPLVPILDELRRRGHEVALRTLASEVAVMEARGFATAPIDPALARLAHHDFGRGGPAMNLRRSVRVFAERAPIDAADLRRAIEATDPTVVLVDVNAWGAVATAEAHGAPWATWCPFPLPIPSRDAPPFGPGLTPATGPAGRLRDRVLSPLVLGSLERIALPRVNAVRVALDLPPVADIAGMSARVAGRRRRAPGAGDHLVGVPGRRAAGLYGARGPGRRAGARGRDHAGRRYAPRRAAQRPRGRVPAPRGRPGPRGVCGDPRGHGCDPEGPGAGRAGRRRPVRA